MMSREEKASNVHREVVPRVRRQGVAPQHLAWVIVTSLLIPITLVQDLVDQLPLILGHVAFWKLGQNLMQACMACCCGMQDL